MAAKLFHNAEPANKKASAGNVIYYTIQHIKSGRRSTGSSITDVLGSGTQLCGNTRLNSLEEMKLVVKYLSCRASLSPY